MRSRIFTSPFPGRRGRRGSVTGVALLAALTLMPALGTAAPRVPVLDSEVLQRLPLRAGDRSQRDIAALRDAARRQPSDQGAAVRLAERYFDQALAEGDPRYVGYADAALARVTALPNAVPSAELRVMQGQLRQYRHDFDAALADFEAALKLDPTLAEAHAWRGAIYLVQADYAAAQRECDALQRLQRPVLVAACRGLAQAYQGQLADSERTLMQALTQAPLAESQLWLRTRLGEVAAWRGQPAAAEMHYRAALALGRDDAYLLAAWSDFLLDQGRPAEVVSLLARWTNADPLLLRLAEAEAALQQPSAAAHIQQLGERFAAAGLRGDTTHLGEEARYHLKLRPDPTRALTLAQANYTHQREPRDARILLQAAQAAGQPAAAQPALDWLRRSGFQDRTLSALATELGTAK